ASALSIYSRACRPHHRREGRDKAPLRRQGDKGHRPRAADVDIECQASLQESARMNFDPYEEIPPAQPTSTEQSRMLWRVQGPSRIIAAALYRHPAGTELRVYFEPEHADDVIESRVERGEGSSLVVRSDELRHRLARKGWADAT